jgi:hypothetical protein
MKRFWTLAVAFSILLVISYPFRLSTYNLGRLANGVLWILTKCWKGVAYSVLGAWGSIPSYLPFYLIVVVCLYAAIKGRKRATIIAPFHLPAENQLPFGEHTVANVLQDAFNDIRKKTEEAIRVRARTVAEIELSDLGGSKLEGPKLPEAIHFEVPTRFAVEVKGFSHESLVSLGRKVLCKEQVISGDVVGNAEGFSLLARSSGTGYWSCDPCDATMEGLRRACQQLALRILETVDPVSFAAYEIAEGRFENAYNRLRKVVEDA